MNFSPELIEARLLRRYKRFLADVELKTGEQITVHCPNTGSMKNCVVPGSPCWLLDSKNTKRKYPLSWILATTASGALACINTLFANQLVGEALVARDVVDLGNYGRVKKEVSYGDASRIDFLLSEHDASLPNCYLEVKSVTLESSSGLGLFPDAVSERATKHVKELVRVKEEGYRAVLLFCVQHTEIARVAPAKEIDPVYANALYEAANQGVEVLAYQAEINFQSMRLFRELPVEL